MTPSDEYYMRRALRLAKKGWGKTSPNPIVGAVLVKNGKIIGEGYHKKIGLPHAEVEAIKAAGGNTEGATLYVTLEPCSSFGKTPPCADLIIVSKIKKVVIAAKDPNPLNRNNGIKQLRKAGIITKVGILEKEAKEINTVFEKFIKKKIPYITAKVAQSLDGKIATATGQSRWITGTHSRRFVHRLRSQVDAVLVGINTVLKDNPRLTNRLYRSLDRQPLKIVLDSRLRVPLESRIFHGNPSGGVILATTNLSPVSRRRFFEKKGIKVIVAKSKNQRVSLKDLMKKLAKMEIAHILLEAGGELLGAFFKEDLVDKVLFFISPKIIGGVDAPTSVMGEGIRRLHFARRLKDIKITRFQEDFLIEGYIR